MALIIREIHASGSAALLNDEWLVIENAGDRPFSSKGCSFGVTKGKGRPRALGTFDPGFTLAPGARIRVVTGNPGKKAHGPAPAESAEMQNYHLFLSEPVLSGPGTVLVLLLRQLEVARAAYDPQAPSGVQR